MPFHPKEETMKKPFHPQAISALILLFLGIAVWFTAGAANGDNRFTIAVIPDTQNYVDNTKKQPASAKDFLTETTYLATHKNPLNLVFVSHVGDVVQHGDGTNGTRGDKSYAAQTEWTGPCVP